MDLIYWRYTVNVIMAVERERGNNLVPRAFSLTWVPPNQGKGSGNKVKGGKSK